MYNENLDLINKIGCIYMYNENLDLINKIGCIYIYNEKIKHCQVTYWKIEI